MKTPRLVFLTGCTHGLGRALVAELVQRGHTVAGCARSAERIAELQRHYPAPHRFAVCDVADDAQVAAFCQTVLAEIGVPDLVLNNAAVITANAPLWEIPAADFGELIDVNVKGPASVMRHLLPAMLERGRGVVVNFSSGWGRSTAPEVAPYCASKFAIEGLSQAVAQETGGRVAVVALNPGIIDTRMLRRSFGAAAADYPEPAVWARSATPFLLGLGPRDNGKALTAPG